MNISDDLQYKFFYFIRMTQMFYEYKQTYICPMFNRFTTIFFISTYKRTAIVILLANN